VTTSAAHDHDADSVMQLANAEERSE